jgi:hypothetical protein
VKYGEFLTEAGTFPISKEGKKNMNIQKILFLILAFGLSVALPVQATTIKVLQEISSPNVVQFLQNDWNPADGDTHWQTVVPDNMSVATDPSLLDFYG